MRKQQPELFFSPVRGSCHLICQGLNSLGNKQYMAGHSLPANNAGIL